MPRPKQSEEEREAMRDRILEAANDVLVQEGPNALSVRAVADRVGVSHMVLYTYFESFEALAQALRARLREWRAASRAEALQQAETGDVVAVMRAALERYTVMAQDRPKMYQFMWVLPVSDGRRSALHTDVLHEPHRPFQGNVRHLTQLVQLGIERGVFVARDPGLAAATVFAIIHAPLMFFYNGRLTDEHLRDQMSAEALEAAMGYLMCEA